MPVIADPDQELVARVARGDPDAIQALVSTKLPRMMALAARLLGDPVEAEDVAYHARFCSRCIFPDFCCSRAGAVDNA